MRSSAGKGLIALLKRGRPDAGFLLLMSYASLLSPVILSLTGCGEKLEGYNYRIENADHRVQYGPVVQRAFRDAEDMLGMKLNEPDNNFSLWRFEEGIAKSYIGYKGVIHKREGELGLMGGWTDNSGNIVVYLTDGYLWYETREEAPAVHEAAHWILFSYGIPASQHHDIMSKAGFRW